MWFILLLLIVSTTAISSSFPSTTTTSDVTYDSVLGGWGGSDTNCQGLVANAICDNGICACQSGYIAEGIMNCVEDEDTSTTTSTTTSSVIYDSVLGGSCDSDTNCQGLVANAICDNGVCACQSGYVPEGTMNCVESQDN